MSSETETVAAIYLQKFCDNGERYGSLDMTQPWVWDGWEYATDARICIRIPANGKLNTPTGDGREFPKASELFNFNPADCVLEWPTEPYFKALAYCPQCDGDGEIFCVECDEKVADCCYPGCSGSHGEFEQEIYRFVGKHRIGVKYDRMISALPGIRWSDKSPSQFGPLFFVFEGGQGMVMGMTRNEKDNHQP